MMIDFDPNGLPTPWGDAGGLRQRMLRPGPGIPGDLVEHSQKERLFAAMVACAAKKGYEGTTVALLLELSGVSRSAFYRHFVDKQDCFIATFEAVVEKSLKLANDELGKSASRERSGRDALQSLFGMIVDQPAAAGLCFNDIYTAGERGRHASERSTSAFVLLAGKAIESIHGGQLSTLMALGVLGGAQSIIQGHLRRSEESRLREDATHLWDWALAYEPPGVPLRLSGRQPRATTGEKSPYLAYSQAERIIRALAAGVGERGYPAVTIAEVAARASVSQATFYSYFPSKHLAFLSALDSAGSQMLAVALPAARRAPDWASGVRAAIGAQCAFGAAEPDLARLAAVEAYAAGPEALEQRDLTTGRMRSLLAPGYEAAPAVNPIVAHAVFGAFDALMYASLVTVGPSGLPGVAPLATYIVLAPFIGAEEAVRVASGDGRAPR